MKTDFASIKVQRSLAAWLKHEAARRGVTMYDLVADLIAHGGHRPWDPPLRREGVK